VYYPGVCVYVCVCVCVCERVCVPLSIESAQAVVLDFAQSVCWPPATCVFDRGIFDELFVCVNMIKGVCSEERTRSWSLPTTRLTNTMTACLQ